MVTSDVTSRDLVGRYDIDLLVELGKLGGVGLDWNPVRTNQDLLPWTTNQCLLDALVATERVVLGVEQTCMFQVSAVAPQWRPISAATMT